MLKITTDLYSLFAVSATSPDDIPKTFDQVAETVTGTLLTVWAGFVEHLPYFVAALLILLLTRLASWIVSRLLHRMWLSRSGLRHSLQELIDRFASITIWLLGLLLAAMVLFPGLTPSKALGAMGIVSIAVGLAFRDIFENFFAGVLLLWRFPFENGDYIECEGITGRVEEVRVRMTTVRLTTGELVVLPNSFLFKNPVQVLTNLPKRRVTIMAGVAYGEDADRAAEVIEKAVRECETVDTSRPVQVFHHGFGSSSIDIEVAWWTDPKPVDQRRSRGEVVSGIKRSLDEAGIEIPFPYRTLTFKESLKLERTG
jgi:small-conductance mechanosensitive channel